MSNLTSTPHSYKKLLTYNLTRTSMQQLQRGITVLPFLLTNSWPFTMRWKFLVWMQQGQEQATGNPTNHGRKLVFFSWENQVRPDLHVWDESDVRRWEDGRDRWWGFIPGRSRSSAAARSSSAGSGRGERRALSHGVKTEGVRDFWTEDEQESGDFYQFAGIFVAQLARRGECGGRNERHTFWRNFSGGRPLTLWRA